MNTLEFSYNSIITDQDDQETQDAGLISFNVDFDQQPDGESLKQACYSVATDEIINTLTEKYGASLFDDTPDLTIRITGLTIS